jgi:hypothetical protein
MNPFYILLFFLLVLESAVFVIVAISPKALQRFIVQKFTKSAKANAFWKIHIIFSFILVLFFIDLHSTASEFEKEKLDIQMRGQHMGSGKFLFNKELRRGFLSYSILKIQRNKYIVFTLFFATIATSVYFRILHYFYEKEEAYGVAEIPEVKENSPKKNAVGTFTF